MLTTTRYNSVIFDTLSANEYWAFLVTEKSVEQTRHNSSPYDDWSVSPIDDVWQSIHTLAQLESNKGLTRLENDECIRAYGAGSSGIQSAWGNLFLVTAVNHTEPMISYFYHAPLARDMNWIHTLKDWNLQESIREAGNWSVPYYPNAPIEYCLAEPLTPHCTIRISATLLLIVTGCNAIKIVCLVTALFARNFEPMATAGDAIASFLDDPELSPEEKGLLSFRDVDGWRGKDPVFIAGNLVTPFRRRPRRWASAATPSRWVLALFL